MNRLLSVLFVPAIACGGGGTPTPMPVDSPPTPDTPDTPAVCPLMATIGGLAFGDGDPAGPNPDEIGPICNAMANPPTPCDWFEKPAEGPNANKRAFVIIARLPDAVDGDTANPDKNFLGFEIVSDNGVFLTGAEKAFDTGPDAPSGSFLFSTAGGTRATEAVAYVIGNLNTTSGALTHIYSASSGGVTLTQVGDTENAKIKGTVSATNYREVDGTADVAGGCSTSLDGMIFNLVQGVNTVAKRTPPPGSDAEAVVQAIDKYKALKFQSASSQQ